MIGVIEFYENAPKDYRTALPSGLICRAPIPFRLGTHADRLGVESVANDRDPKTVQFSLERTDLRDFDPTHIPDIQRHLNIKSDEFLLSIGYKYRKCIITSEPILGTDYGAPGENGFIVTPLYSTKNEAGDFKSYINYEMILKAQAYQLHNVFFMPESTQFGISESFARLDRACFVNVELIQPSPVTLTNRAIELLREWTWKCFGFPLEGLDPALDKFIEKAGKELEARLKTNSG